MDIDFGTVIDDAVSSGAASAVDGRSGVVGATVGAASLAAATGDDTVSGFSKADRTDLLGRTLQAAHSAIHYQLSM